MRYLSYEKKTRVNDKVVRVNIPDYQLRFNQKKEISVDVNSSLVRECMQQWENIPKVFRYKKQYSYQTLDKEFRRADRCISISHKHDWDVIRKIDKANGVVYDCN